MTSSLNDVSGTNVSAVDLFLCLTPFHLFISNVIALSEAERQPESRRKLIVSDRISRKCMRVLTEKKMWSEVFRFDMGTRSVGRAVKRFRKLSDDAFEGDLIDRMFVGNDLDIGAQLLIATARPNELHVYDDGIGSYVRASTLDGMHRVLYRMIMYGLRSCGKVRNFAGLGRHPQAAAYWTLREDSYPSLGDSVSRNLIDLKHSSVEAYLESIRARLVDQSRSRLGDRPFIIVVSEPLPTMSESEFRDVYVTIGKYISRNCKDVTIWFKKHPREGKTDYRVRLGALEQGAGRSVITLDSVYSELPVEMIAAACPECAGVMGIVSTALLNTKLLAPEAKVLSFAGELSAKRSARIVDYRRLVEELTVTTKRQ